ncbi:MAG: hypothetical protein ACPHCI_06140 [Solirubrobacterales bacterium]
MTLKIGTALTRWILARTASRRRNLKVTISQHQGKRARAASHTPTLAVIAQITAGITASEHHGITATAAPHHPTSCSGEGWTK